MSYRLPTIQELYTLVNYNKSKPASDLPLEYRCNGDYYISSTKAIAPSYGHYMGVHFEDGVVKNIFPDGPIGIWVIGVKEVDGRLEWGPPSQCRMNFKEAEDYVKGIQPYRPVPVEKVESIEDKKGRYANYSRLCRDFGLDRLSFDQNWDAHARSIFNTSSDFN